MNERVVDRALEILQEIENLVDSESGFLESTCRKDGSKHCPCDNPECDSCSED